MPLSWAAERHTAFGVVLQIDRAHHTLRVSCLEIPGYMDAMAMDFPVRNGKDLDGLQPGTLIDFTVVVEKGSAYAAAIRHRRSGQAETGSVSQAITAHFSQQIELSSLCCTAPEIRVAFRLAEIMAT